MNRLNEKTTFNPGDVRHQMGKQHGGIMFYKVFTLLILLSIFVCSVYAEKQDPGIIPNALELPNLGAMAHTRTAPAYTFSRTPVSLMNSYNDYMIGSYNGLPLRLIPDSAGGGYFMTYHGQRTATGTRRVYYASLNSSGIVVNNAEITLSNTREGFPTVAVDPVSGKPLYAWHSNADADATLEVRGVADAFIDGIDGLWNELQTIVNNPSVIGSTTDNEFIWPTAIVGPSPINGKRRIYVVSRNSVSHALESLPSENSIIAYTDFNGMDLENGVTLVWSYTSIPTLNQWNTDTTTLRRPNFNLACDNAGNLYYIGYHSASTAGSVHVEEPDVDVFKCGAYGAGTWTRLIFSSDMPTWNPPASPGGPGYFVDSDTNTPYTNAQLSWQISNSSHVNATVDNNGKIHVPGLWSINTYTGSYYYGMQFVKEMVFDTNTNTLSINEVYPQKDPLDAFNQAFTPWDRTAPFGVVDEYGEDNAGSVYPVMVGDWNFPYWNNDSHDNAMMFHCGGMKITESNPQGMMAIVWQNSQRARWYNESLIEDYAAYANTPEIFISVSEDNGQHWSEPIIINNQETTQFAGIKPMWVYPADKIKYTGMQNGQKVGKLGLMFYDDNTWGSNSHSPTEFPNDGGRVMFTELQIVFPGYVAPPVDPFGSVSVLSGSMSMMAGVMIDGVMAADGDVVAAFVNVGGVPQLRGKGTVAVNNGTAACLVQIYTETNGETVFFKVWDQSTGQVSNINETLSSQVNGIVGEWPNNLYWLHALGSITQTISLNSGWNMVSLNVHPTNLQIDSVFSGVMAYLQSVKSTEGVYIPNNPYSTITSLADGKGYYVKVSQSCTLTVTGVAINQSTPIALAAGWNLAAFTPQSAISVATAVASLGTNLVQVKGTEGIYIPGNPYNTLTSLSPGRSYWIKLNAAASLVYPAPGKGEAQAMLPSCEVWGCPTVKSNSQAILASLDGIAHSGDILAAFVGEELRGLATVMDVNGNAGALLQVFTDEAGEQLQFKLLNPATNVISSLLPNLQSAPGETIGDYQNGEYLSFTTDHSDTPGLVTSLLAAYPNPFKDGTSIAMNIAKDTPNIKVEVYNVRGQKVRTLFQGKPQPGAQKLWWNGLDDGANHVSSGLYFLKMTDGTYSKSIKLMILK